MAAKDDPPGAIADRARYVGSGEHKRVPNPLAEPALRTDASDCDLIDPMLSSDPAKLVRVLQAAIRRGQVQPADPGVFPRYAWGWLVRSDGGRSLFEARLTNVTSGQYKGYFIDEEDLIGKRAWLRRKLLNDGPWTEALT